jgi:hypothetical protein
MSDTRLPPHKCTACGYDIDCATGLKPDEIPEPGSISICLNCGAIGIYTQDMQLRQATRKEEAKLLRSSMGVMVMLARGHIKRRGIIPRLRNKKPQ